MSLITFISYVTANFSEQMQYFYRSSRSKSISEYTQKLSAHQKIVLREKQIENFLYNEAYFWYLC